MYNNLLEEIFKRDLSISDFSRFINIPTKRLKLKLAEKQDFNYKEVVKILEFFNCQLSADYLFSNK